MLDPEEQRRFEAHMAVCEGCRARSLLLGNLVQAVRNQELTDQAARSEQIADRAYEQGKSWDVLFLSWLRPAPAWAGLAALVVFLSLLWVRPFSQQTISGSECNTLLAGSGQASQGESTLTTLTDDELERWLEQGGTGK